MTIRRRRGPKPVISTASLDAGERHLRAGVRSISISPTNSLSRSRANHHHQSDDGPSSLSPPIKWALRRAHGTRDKYLDEVQVRKMSQPPNWWTLGAGRTARTRRSSEEPADVLLSRLAPFVPPPHLAHIGGEEARGRIPRRKRIRRKKKRKERTGGAEKSAELGN